MFLLLQENPRRSPRENHVHSSNIREAVVSLVMRDEVCFQFQAASTHRTKGDLKKILLKYRHAWRCGLGSNRRMEQHLHNK